MAYEIDETNIIWKDEDYDYTGGFAIEKREDGLYVICLMECGFCRLEFNLTKALKEIEDGKFDDKNKDNTNQE